MRTPKEPIRLRKRVLKTGNTSLYLDIYINGHRSYEYLNLYLIPERTRADKDKNRQTLQLAEAVRAKRIVELQNKAHGFNSGDKSGANFMDYYDAFIASKANKRRSTVTLLKNAQSRWIERFGTKLTFRDIDAAKLRQFKGYLENVAVCSNAAPLKKSTAAMYFQMIRTCIHHALKAGVIRDDPFLNVENIRKEDTERCYLTLDEVRRMAATPCRYENLRRAFLFSCLTGLRRSDILKLTWGEVRNEGEFTRIVFTQKKTGGLEYIDINPQAVPLMGERKNDNECVFKKFTTQTTSSELPRWAAAAGINKHVTFHSARHSFAVILLELDVDIYTVQKLLGHRSLATTQIYAKVVDKKKQEAAMRIPSIFGNDPTKYR